MRYTQSAIQSAILEISNLIEAECLKYNKQGYSLKASDSAPEGYKALQSSLMPSTKHELLHSNNSQYLEGKFTDTKNSVEVTTKRKARIMPVANYGSDSSIYGKRINIMFRFWHDMLHLDNGLGFSKEDEFAVADLHIKAGKEAGLSSLALNILNFDTRGQVQYYFNHKEFIKDQEAFIASCLSRGMSVAVRCKH